MEQIRISAKNLGAVSLDDFCPRCYWVKLKTQNKLPWQIFPGIFSSIDAYTKKAVHAMINQKPQPQWLKELGDISRWEKVPHWSKFKSEFPQFGIVLNGVPDDFLIDQENGLIIPDYKTAKFTPNQDRLKPMYEIQLNGYSMIAKSCIDYATQRLFLIYMEPITDDLAANTNLTEIGFAMGFSAHPVKVEIDPEMVFNAMDRTRKIYDLARPPEGDTACKNCQKLEAIIKILQTI